VDDNATTPEMNDLIIAIETDLGAVIDSKPFDPSDVYAQRWELTEDRQGRAVLEVAGSALLRSAHYIGAFSLFIGCILLPGLGQYGDPEIEWHRAMVAIPLTLIGAGVAFLFGWTYRMFTHTRFRFDTRKQTFTNTTYLHTAGKKLLSKTISLDRIAALQLCGALTNKGPIMQLNLVLTKPAADRVKLIEFGMNIDHFVDIATELAETIDKPLIVHETENIIEVQTFTLHKGLQLHGHGGKRKGPKKRDLSHLPELQRKQEEENKKTDFLSALEDKLHPDGADNG
jgi:hypothetical protein